MALLPNRFVSLIIECIAARSGEIYPKGTVAWRVFFKHSIKKIAPSAMDADAILVIRNT